MSCAKTRKGMFPFLDGLDFSGGNLHMSAAPVERSSEAEVQLAERHHVHRKVSGGWLRAAVFGAMDGLVTNASLIAGVGAGGASHHFLVVGGLAGLIAGAFSMAAGEWTSVHAQNGM